MPEKNPDLWAMAAAWLSAHSPVIYGGLLAMATAIVRVIYAGGTFRQWLLEGVLCGLLSLTLSSGLGLVGLPMSAASFMGGMVGFLGVETLREVAIKVLGRKADNWRV